MTVYSNKSYSDDDIRCGLRPDSAFGKKAGGSITVVQCYKQWYTINTRTVGHLLLMCKILKQSTMTGMPPTVILITLRCQITGLFDEMTNNFNFMKVLSNYRCLEPVLVHINTTTLEWSIGPKIGEVSSFNVTADDNSIWISWVMKYEF